MVYARFLWLSVLLATQESELDRLILQLQSDSLEEREVACNRLRRLGPSALPALNTLIEGKDAEIVVRARQLIKCIELRQQMPSGIAGIEPALDERLLSGQWLDVLLEATGKTAAGKYRYPPLRSQDIVFLALPALRQASSTLEKHTIITCAKEHRLYPLIGDLCKLLTDNAAEIRCAAAKALGQMGAYETDADIAALLTSKSDDERIIGIQELASLHATKYVPRIVPFLKDSNPRIRHESASALAELNATAASMDIVSLLSDPDDIVREVAVVSLGRLNNKECAGTISPLLADSSLGVRLTTLDVLRRLRCNTETQAIRPLVRAKEFSVRLSAAAALASVGDQEGINELVAFTRAGVDEDREKVIRVIGETRLEQTIPLLSSLVEDESAQVRQSAVLALKEMQSETSANGIVRFLLDRDVEVVIVALNAIVELKFKSASSQVKRLLAHADSEIRGMAALVLGKLGDSGAMEAIIKLLGDSSPKVRAKSAEALGSLNIKGTVTRLEALLKDSDPAVIIAAILAVERISGSDAINSIRPLLTDEKQLVRRVAAQALCRVGCIAAVPVVLECSERDPMISLGCINGVRLPGKGRDLLEKGLYKRREGTRLEIMKGVCLESGVKLELPQEIEYRRDPWLWSHCEIEETSRLHALERTLDGSDFDFIVLEDRVRVVEKLEAISFWRNWFSANEKREGLDGKHK